MTHLITLDLNDRLGRKIAFLCDTLRGRIIGAWISEAEAEDKVILDAETREGWEISGMELYELLRDYIQFPETK